MLLCTFFLSSLRSTACNVSIGKAAKDIPPAPYVFLLFFNSEEAREKAYEKRLSKFVYRHAPRINITFDSVDMSHKYHRDYLVTEYKIKKSPTTLLVSPNGTILLRSSEYLKNETIKDILISPGRKKIAKQLKEHMAVVVFAVKDPEKKKKHIQSIVKEAQGLSKIMLNGSRLGQTILSLDDKREKWLYKFMKIPEKPDKKMYMTVIFGNGKSMEAFAGTVKKNDVLDYVQLLSHPCGCNMNWNWFQDLLLPIAFGEKEGNENQNE